MSTTRASNRASAGRPPIGLFTLTLAASAALLGCLGWTLHRDGRVLEGFRTHERAAERLVASLAALADGVESATRIAVLEGSDAAEARSRRVGAALDESFARLRELDAESPLEADRVALGVLRAARERALDHARAGRRAEALATLDADRTQAFAAMLREGLRLRAEGLAARIDRGIAREEGAAAGAALLGAIAAAMLAVAWVRTARGLLRHQRSRAEAEAALAARNDALAIQSESMRRIALEAEAAHRAQSELLARVSHELRSPLQTLMGSVELIDGPRAGRPGGEHHAAILRAGRRLEAMVNDLIDVASIDGAANPPVRRDVEPEALVRSIVAPYAVLARDKGLNFVLEVADGLPAQASTDPDDVRQVLARLLANAIAYTESGSIRVAIGAERRGQLSMLAITVADTGIGMDGATMARAFEPFARGDESTTRRAAGAGLGLALARRLARRLDGDLEVDSAPGRGSTFVFRFAARAAAPDSEVGVKETARRPHRIAPHDGPARILLAEDAEDNQRLFAAFLARPEYAVRVAADGAAARRIALEEGPFDLVLMDMQMPRLDGYDATRSLREAGYDAPIVALTAHATLFDRRRCLEAGCDEYATKPIDRAGLLELVNAWIAPAASDRAAA